MRAPRSWARERRCLCRDLFGTCRPIEQGPFESHSGECTPQEKRDVRDRDTPERRKGSQRVPYYPAGPGGGKYMVRCQRHNRAEGTGAEPSRNESEYRLLLERKSAFLDAVQDPMYILDREGCAALSRPGVGKGVSSGDGFRGRHISEILALEAARTVWCCLQQASSRAERRFFGYPAPSRAACVLEGRIVVSEATGSFLSLTILPTGDRRRKTYSDKEPGVPEPSFGRDSP
jgi:hypothetical protein